MFFLTLNRAQRYSFGLLLSGNDDAQQKVERNLSASRDGAGDQVHAGAALLEGLQGLTPGRMPNLLAAFYGAGGALAPASSEHGGRP